MWYNPAPSQCDTYGTEYAPDGLMRLYASEEEVARRHADDVQRIKARRAALSAVGLPPPAVPPNPDQPEPTVDILKMFMFEDCHVFPPRLKVIPCAHTGCLPLVSNLPLESVWPSATQKVWRDLCTVHTHLSSPSRAHADMYACILYCFCLSVGCFNDLACHKGSSCLQFMQLQTVHQLTSHKCILLQARARQLATSRELPISNLQLLPPNRSASNNKNLGRGISSCRAAPQLAFRPVTQSQPVPHAALHLFSQAVYREAATMSTAPHSLANRSGMLQHCSTPWLDFVNPCNILLACASPCGFIDVLSLEIVYFCLL